MATDAPTAGPSFTDELMYTGLSVGSYFLGIWAMNAAKRYSMIVGAFVFACSVLFTMEVFPIVRSLYKDGTIVWSKSIIAGSCVVAAALAVFMSRSV